MPDQRYLAGESDIFVGRRGRLRRYLVCSMEGFFPVLARTGPNALAVVYRTGAPHVGVSGTLAVARSEDGGVSWSDPCEIAPRWDDNRNPALGVNAKGELAIAFWKARLHAYTDPDGLGLRYTGSDDERTHKTAGLFHGVSPDQGRGWNPFRAYASTLLALASPYGRILTLPDGTLLMAIYGSPREPIEGIGNISVLARSADGGQTWGDETLTAQGYNETSYALLPNGDLLAAARSESGHVAVSPSHDLGHTWSKPMRVTRDGEHPADLTVLQSGRVLLTFGRRIRPMGCGALWSEDGGHTWRADHEVLLAGDGVESADLGYPSTVQLADGHIVTALYYASGSEMSEAWRGWGAVSCQAIHYQESDIL